MLQTWTQTQPWRSPLIIIIIMMMIVMQGSGSEYGCGGFQQCQSLEALRQRSLTAQTVSTPTHVCLLVKKKKKKNGCRRWEINHSFIHSFSRCTHVIPQGQGCTLYMCLLVKKKKKTGHMLCEFIHSFSLCMHVCQKPGMHSREHDPVRVPALVTDIPTIRHVDAS